MSETQSPLTPLVQALTGLQVEIEKQEGGPVADFAQVVQKATQRLKALAAGVTVLLVFCAPLGADVGFRPPDGATVHWAFPGGRISPVTTRFTYTGNVFPNTPAMLAARYGEPPLLSDGSNVRANFTVDAETVLTVMCATLSKASQDPKNPWGLRPGVASPLECHDWAATMEAQGWAGSQLRRMYNPDSLPGGAAGAAPGQPRITEISSPAPGRISVKWVTRKGHSAFVVKAGDVAAATAGDVFGTELDFPVGGPVDVTVTAFHGGVAGKPSLPKMVNVEPRPAATTPSPVKPDPPVNPQPADPPVTPPASPGVCLEIPGSPGSRLLVRVVAAEECKP